MKPPEVSSAAGKLTRLRELILQLARLNTKCFFPPEPLSSGKAKSISGLARTALRQKVNLSWSNISYYYCYLYLVCLFMVVCFVCLCVYMRVCTYVCVWASVCLCLSVGMCVCVCVFDCVFPSVFVCPSVCMEVCKYVSIHACASLYRCVVCVYV